MGDYYHDLKEALIASGIPFEDAKWMHLYETESEFNTAYAEDYKEPWVSYVEELSGVAYDKVYLTGVSFQNLKLDIDVPISGGTVNKDSCSYVVLSCYDNGEVFDITSAATVTGSTNISESYITERHSAGTLTLTASYSGFSVSSSVTVYQEGATYEEIPLTFNIISAGTIVWKAQNASYTTTIEYSRDDGKTWTSITSTTEGASIPVNAGDTVQFRGDNAAYALGEEEDTNYFGDSTAKFTVDGNIMSLVNSTGFMSATTLSADYTFNCLFQECTGLTSVENLILPANTLTDRCYQFMFYGCSSLVTAPSILPATALANGCYDNMFSNCTSLTTAPSLPATTLASGCYAYMFNDCTSLMTAPELPAIILANYCYYQMFAGCSKLTTAPSILPATTLADYCYAGMFYGCTSLTTAPELPATTLANYCYQGMFNNCSSLNYIKCLATDISASNCTSSWVNGVAATGTFVKNASMTGWTTGNNGIPSGWDVQDAS